MMHKPSWGLFTWSTT